MEELLEQQVGPLCTQVKLAKRCADIARVQDGVGDQLLAVLNRPLRLKVNDGVGVLTVFDLQNLQVVGELVPQVLHLCHVRVDDSINDSLSEQLSLLR